MDKKMMKYVGILVGLLVLLVLFLMISNSLKGGVKYSYPEMEDKLVKAAKKYVENKQKNNINILPSAPGESLQVSALTLINEGYLDDLSGYAKDEVTCSGTVEIYNAGNGNYDYVPYLVCGVKHETKRLADKVIEDNDSGVTFGSGLYQRVEGKFVTRDSDFVNGGSQSYEYVFRGNQVNNYLQIDDNLWRIVAIDEDNNLLIIMDNHSQKTFAWDDKYNEEVNKYQGVNDYETNGLKSNIYKTLTEFYDGSITLMNREKYSPNLKHLVVPMDLCVGKRSDSETDISGRVECQTKLEEQYIGLLPAYYYMSASLDDSCTTITSKNCGNYNYLSQFDNYWWLLTANSENSNEAFAIAKKFSESYVCSYRADIRPVVKIGGRAIYNDGDGTEKNPYTIKFYENED